MIDFSVSIWSDVPEFCLKPIWLYKGFLSTYSKSRELITLLKSCPRHDVKEIPL